MNDKKHTVNSIKESDIESTEKPSIEQLMASAILWLEKQCAPKCWDLSDKQICTLLGDIAQPAWCQWKETALQTGRLELGEEAVQRVALLVNINEMISMSAPSNYHYDFFKRPINHPTFNGKSAKEYLLESTKIDDFYVVRNHFRSRVLF